MSSPASAVLPKRYDFLPSVPPHFVTFVWRYLRVHSLFRSPADECAAEAWKLVTRYSGRDVAEETTGDPKFLENPDCPFAMFKSTPAGLLTPDRYRCSSMAWYGKSRGSTKVFRRSIAWLPEIAV